MAVAYKKTIRHTDRPVAPKTKAGGRTVVSRALTKPGATNLVAKLHVKRGDTVMLISGPKKTATNRSPETKKSLDRKNIYRGTVGKILNVFPSKGKIIVEGVNIITRATKSNPLKSRTGLVQKEGPIFASKVMLYCTACKKPTRAKMKPLDKPKTSPGIRQTRTCRHCNEAFDA